MAARTFRSSGYFFIAVLALTVVAFWKPYVARMPGDFPIYAHLHAGLMLCWLGMLIAQPFMIRAGRRSVHRALGKVSYVLVPLIAAATLSLAHVRLKQASPEQWADAAHSLYLPFGMLALFLFAYVLAIVNRKTQALHARYMVCTVLGLVDPIVARVGFFYFPELPDFRYYQAISYGISAVALVVLILRERDERVGRAAFPVMLGATTVVYALWFTLAQSDAWLPVARGFRDLPLT